MAKSYTTSTWSKVVMTFICTGMIGGLVYFIVQIIAAFNEPLMKHPKVIFIIALLVAVIIIILFELIETLQYRITINHNNVSVRRRFKTEQLLFSQIKGYTSYDNRYYGKQYEIVPNQEELPTLTTYSQLKEATKWLVSNYNEL